MIELTKKIFNPENLKYLAGSNNISRFDIWILGTLLSDWNFETNFSQDEEFPTRIVPGTYYGLHLYKTDKRGDKPWSEFSCPILWGGDDKQGVVYLDYFLPQNFTARASFKMFSWWDGYKEFKGDGRRFNMPKIDLRYDKGNDISEIIITGTTDRTLYSDRRFLSVDIDLSKSPTCEPYSMFIEFDKQYMRLLRKRLRDRK